MESTTKRRPIRGFIYGIFFGLGLALIAIGQGLAALGTWPPFIILVLGTAAGTLWSIFGPAKGAKPVRDAGPPNDAGPTGGMGAVPGGDTAA